RDTQSVFDANIVYQGSRRIQGVLTGDVDIRRASYTKEITLDELIQTGGPFGPDFVDIGPGGGGGAALPITVDLRISADNTLSVRNNLADALGSAYLNVRGPLSEPQVSGRVMLSQGTLQFRNDRYELTRGLVTFPPQRRSEPVLDIMTESDISGHRVSVNFSGTLSKLKTTLRSDPELPEKDIVALILTGTVTGGRSEAAVVTQSGLGLAQSILAASLSEQIEKGTRLFGLSRFSIDPLWVGRGNDPTARVTVGRRVTKDLTITYSQNLTSGPSGVDRVALVEYRLSNRFSLVGIRNERGELGFDVRIRKRF
ncbi:MAG TPA: translocation/assembly module TamB domain-containing protein, partial [Blastocatellia bacterium]|nr:translocation/assembly module TamB domain-containing protein [Blastocatellia bacterium]